MIPELVQQRLSRARTELDAARHLSDGHFSAQAATRAYYAAFHAADAALVLKGESRSSHSGLISGFGLLVVKPGGFDKTIAELLRDLFDLRNDAEYEFLPITEDQAKEAIEAASRFVVAVEKWVAAHS